MARKNPYRPFVPDPVQIALKPQISGNAINGLGETEPRQPRMVYWAPDPDGIPHGKLQRYFYTQGGDHAARAKIREERQAILDTPLPDVAAVKTDLSEQDWENGLERFVATAACEKVGVAALDPA